MKALLAATSLTLLASCTQESLTRTGRAAEQTADKLVNRGEATPVVAQWRVYPAGPGHGLDVIVNGKRIPFHTGGAYRTGRRVDVAMPGSVSAFRVDDPFGGYSVYELIPVSASSSRIYVRDYNATTRQVSPARLLKTVSH